MMLILLLCSHLTSAFAFVSMSPSKFKGPFTLASTFAFAFASAFVSAFAFALRQIATLRLWDVASNAKNSFLSN